MCIKRQWIDADEVADRLLIIRVLPVAVDIQAGAAGGVDEAGVEIAAAPVADVRRGISRLLNEVDLLFHHRAPGLRWKLVRIPSQMCFFMDCLLYTSDAADDLTR